MKMLSPEAILYYADYPVDFVEDIIRVKPDKYQADILRSLAKEQLTSVRSGHGIGKSAVESWAIYWFMTTRPFPKVPCTAPTQHQLFDILWAELSKWRRNNPVLENDFVWTQQKLYLRGYPEEWFAVARTAATPDALQGFHADHVLYIIDEASGVDDVIFEPILGALSTANAKLLACGNPTKLTGFFYDSHHKNRESFATHHVDGRMSSRVSSEFVQKVIDMYGEDSDVFRVRVAGEFPRALADSFIPMDWALRSSELNLRVATPNRVDLGVDVARYGDDDSVIAPVHDFIEQMPAEIYHHNDTMELTGHTVAKIKWYARQYPGLALYVKVDCDGLGVGVYDRLVEQKAEILDAIGAEYEKRIEAGELEPNTAFTLEIVECHFGAEGGTINEDDPIEFENSTGVMWGTIREALRSGTFKLWNSDKLISQLSNRKYTINSKGQIRLERKEDMKKRGLSSPDIGDALGLALYNPLTSDWSID